MNNPHLPDKLEAQPALTEAAILALSRFENNKAVDTFDGSFWKTCAWAMADDLKRVLMPNDRGQARRDHEQ